MSVYLWGFPTGLSSTVLGFGGFLLASTVFSTIMCTFPHSRTQFLRKSSHTHASALRRLSIMAHGHSSATINQSPRSMRCRYQQWCFASFGCLFLYLEEGTRIHHTTVLPCTIPCRLTQRSKSNPARMHCRLLVALLPASLLPVTMPMPSYTVRVTLLPFMVIFCVSMNF